MNIQIQLSATLRQQLVRLGTHTSKYRAWTGDTVSGAKTGTATEGSPPKVLAGTNLCYAIVVEDSINPFRSFQFHP